LDERSAADRVELADGKRWAFANPVFGGRAVEGGRITIERAAPAVLVVDATRVGRAVVDLLQAAEIEDGVYPRTITAGHEWRREDGQSYVPQKDLVGAVQTGLESGSDGRPAGGRPRRMRRIPCPSGHRRTVRPGRAN
jgi:hypothetical protein